MSALREKRSPQTKENFGPKTNLFTLFKKFRQFGLITSLLFCLFFNKLLKSFPEVTFIPCQLLPTTYEKTETTCMTALIQFSYLPDLSFWHKDGLRFLGSVLGRPLYLDEAYQNMS